MLELKTIIPIIVSIVIIAGVGYYLYSCIQHQTATMASVAQRCDALERMFMRPPVAELESVFNKPRQRASCRDGVCTLDPVITNEQEFNQIVSDEISNMKLNNGGSEQTKAKEVDEKQA